MLLFTCYLASGALFYYLAAKRAPVCEDPAFDYATQPAKCEVIELFNDVADQPARKAA